jgi:hypothetical protein
MHQVDEATEDTGVRPGIRPRGGRNASAVTCTSAETTYNAAEGDHNNEEANHNAAEARHNAAEARHNAAEARHNAAEARHNTLPDKSTGKASNEPVRRVVRHDELTGLHFEDLAWSVSQTVCRSESSP